MSTDLTRTSGKGAAAVLVLALWMVACAGAWDRSNVSGGGAAVTVEARDVGAHVAKANGLTPACEVLASQLVDAASRARIAAARPSGVAFSRQAAAAAANWRSGRCPDGALVGIAYGAASIASERLVARERGTVFRWPG